VYVLIAAHYDTYNLYVSNIKIFAKKLLCMNIKRQQNDVFRYVCIHVNRFDMYKFLIITIKLMLISGENIILRDFFAIFIFLYCRSMRPNKADRGLFSNFFFFFFQ
jgi:hypothetical protein